MWVSHVLYVSCERVSHVFYMPCERVSRVLYMPVSGSHMFFTRHASQNHLFFPCRVSRARPLKSYHPEQAEFVTLSLLSRLDFSGCSERSCASHCSPLLPPSLLAMGSVQLTPGEKAASIPSLTWPVMGWALCTRPPPEHLSALPAFPFSQG